MIRVYLAIYSSKEIWGGISRAGFIKLGVNKCFGVDPYEWEENIDLRALLNGPSTCPEAPVAVNATSSSLNIPI